MGETYRLDILVAPKAYDRTLGFLTLHVPFGWEEASLPTGDTRFSIHNDKRAFVQSLQDDLRDVVPGAQCSVTALESQDWLMAWRQFFTPVPCGTRFVVLPPWLAQTRDFPGRTPIIIEPKSAFGTGHHATTALCLAALSDLLDAGRVRAGQRFLDLGTGTGVLGLACCKSGLTGHGCDTDPLAIENAQENVRCNAVEGFTLVCGSVDALLGHTYDVVLANILAQPLMDMAPSVVAACAPGACLVLSGLLTTQADEVEAAYRAQGLPAASKRVDGEWIALVW